MNEEEFNLLEVKAESTCWYLVTLYQFNKDSEEDPDYFQEWLYYNGSEWDYINSYEGNCLVCFIHEKGRSYE